MNYYLKMIITWYTLTYQACLKSKTDEIGKMTMTNTIKRNISSKPY